MPAKPSEPRPDQAVGLQAEDDPREAYARFVLEEERRGRKVPRRLRRAARAVLRRHAL